MTQKQLAESVGVSRQTLNAIENSKHAPTIDIAIRIADVFGVPVDGLFECTYDGKPKHRSNARKITTVRKQASVEKATDDSAEHSSVEEEAKNVISLGDLRNMF
jgi:putative transcriptional regulator